VAIEVQEEVDEPVDEFHVAPILPRRAASADRGLEPFAPLTAQCPGESLWRPLRDARSA